MIGGGEIRLMTIEAIRQPDDAVPFQPFVVHPAYGRHIPVLHRECIAAAPRGRTLVVIRPDDSFNIIDLLLVTDAEPKQAASNGSGRKRKN